MSAFSITPEREQEVGFTPPYMNDICVLISSQNIPIVKSAEEFDALFSKLTALTIKETTYEHDLKKLEKRKNLLPLSTTFPAAKTLYTSSLAAMILLPLSICPFIKS